MMCSLQNEDADKDDQVLMVFQHHPVMEPRVSSLQELQSSLDYWTAKILKL